MLISTYKPNFSKNFKENVETSKKKGAVVSISSNSNEKTISIDCRGFSRLFGTLQVKLNDGVAEIISCRIIERDFYPYEAMITKLISSLRRRKIKKLKT
jgi:hypothetical protein